jgi:acylaminoacyl-peptidase
MATPTVPDSDSGAFTSVASVSVPRAAQFISPRALSVTLGTRDYVANKRRTYSQAVYLSDHPGADAECEYGPFHEDDTVALDAYRYDEHSRRAVERAVLRNVQVGDSKRRVVEVWSLQAGAALQSSVEVTNVHGEFYADEHVGSLSFSANGSMLVYVAEKRVARRPTSTADFLHDADFGETYWGKPSPVLVSVLRVSDQNAAGPPAGQVSHAEEQLRPQIVDLDYANLSPMKVRS